MDILVGSVLLCITLNEQIGSVETMIKKPKSRSKGDRINQLKKCEWCNQYLPNERYHLRICPDCRKTTLQAIKKDLL